MKTNTSLRVVESNTTDTKDFTIQASGKMFNMVISGLYSNKPKSITREIWSNAFDAHAMVGKEDVPFEVTFPSSLAPVFRCRDFGPGIAHEDMSGFYTVLGHSTKGDTNKAVGKWGVGRMSPLSYTDTFSVVSRHKGMVAHYLVQLGRDGAPQLHTLSLPTPTTEASGLEVSFPVQNRDIREFQSAARLVAYGMPVAPVSPGTELRTIDKVLEGDDYYFYKDYELQGAYAQMGCVLYPIQRGLVPNKNIVYKFEIGELEVTASREDLSYGPNDPTASAIVAKHLLVQDQLLERVQTAIDSKPSLYLASQMYYRDLQHIFPNDNKVGYKGQALVSQYSADWFKNLQVYRGSKGYKSKTIGFGTGSTFGVRETPSVFIQDVSKPKENVRAATRIAANLKPHQHYLWIRMDCTNPVANAELAQFMQEIGAQPTYVRDLDDNGAAAKAGRKVVVTKLYGHSHDMDDAEFALGGHWVPMSNNIYPDLLDRIKGWEVLPDAILVPKTLWKKFEANKLWKPLLAEVSNLAQKEAKAARDALRLIKPDHWSIRWAPSMATRTCPVGTFAKKLMQPMPDKYLGMGVARWNTLLIDCGLEPIKQEAVDISEVLDKYPLLKVYDPQLDKAFHDYVTKG
jgi:hypothetical protein